MKILFPTDFSKASMKAKECLTELPGLGEVVFLHAPLPAEELGAEGQRLLEQWADEFRAGGAEAAIEVVEAEPGTVHQAIVGAAREQGVDLIVMGSRGHGWLRQAFLGSVASDVARATPVPLLIERLRFTESGECERVCTSPFRHILAATDFSESAERLLVFLQGLPGLQKLTLIHVLELPVVHVLDPQAAEEVEAVRKKAEDELARLAERFRKANGAELERVVRFGIASQELMAAAKELDASCIALGKRGQSRLAELLWGSTAEAVARRADRPVLLVP